MCGGNSHPCRCWLWPSSWMGPHRPVLLMLVSLMSSCTDSRWHMMGYPACIQPANPRGRGERWRQGAGAPKPISLHSSPLCNFSAPSWLQPTTPAFLCSLESRWLSQLGQRLESPQPLTLQLCALLMLALKNVNALCTVILATVQCFPCVCVPYACEAVTSCPESEFRILAARTVSSLLYKPLVPACVLFSRENLSFFKEQKTGVQRWFFHVGPRLPYFFFFGFPSFL